MSARDLLAVLVTILVLTSGCGESSSDCPESGVVEHHSTRVGPMVVARSLCETIEFAHESIGVYRVESLKTYVVDDPYHTHVELSLLNEWKPNSARNPILRGSGGPGSECRGSANSSISTQLTVGETIVAFLREPQPEVNQGYYYFPAQGVYQETDTGRFSNGFLFVDGGLELAEFEELVKTNGFDPAAPDFCSQDVRPE